MEGMDFYETTTTTVHGGGWGQWQGREQNENWSQEDKRENWNNHQTAEAIGERTLLNEPLLTQGRVGGYGTGTIPPRPPSQESFLEVSEDLESGGASWDSQTHLRGSTVRVGLPYAGAPTNYQAYLTQPGARERFLSGEDEEEEAGWSFEAQRRKWATRQRAWIERLRSSSTVNEEGERQRSDRSVNSGFNEGRRQRAGTERHSRSASSGFEQGGRQRADTERHLRSSSSGFEQGGRPRADTERHLRSASSNFEEGRRRRAGTERLPPSSSRTYEQVRRQRPGTERHLRSSSSGFEQVGRQRSGVERHLRSASSSSEQIGIHSVESERHLRSSEQGSGRVRRSLHLRSASGGYEQGERQHAWSLRRLRSASSGHEQGDKRDLEAAVGLGSDDEEEDCNDDDSTTTDWLRQDHLHEHRKNLSVSSLSSCGRNLSLTAEQLTALGIVYIPPILPAENGGLFNKDTDGHPLRPNKDEPDHPLHSNEGRSDQQVDQHPLRPNQQIEQHPLRPAQNEENLNPVQSTQDIEAQPLRPGYVTPPSPLGGSDYDGGEGGSQADKTNMNTQGGETKDENFSAKSQSLSRSRSNDNGNATTPRFETRSHSRRYRDNPAEDDDVTDEGDGNIDCDHSGVNGDASSHRHGGSIRSDGLGSRRRRNPCIRLGYSEEDEADRQELIQTAANRTTHLNIQSHNYEPDESEVWRAYVAQQHFRNRGQWWTTGKKRAVKRWILTFLVGVIQGIVAFLCNIASRRLSERKFDHVNYLLQKSWQSPTVLSTNLDSSVADFYVGDAEGEDQYFTEGEDASSSDETSGSGAGDSGDNHHFSFGGSAFLAFLFYQTLYAAIASLFVYFEPVAAGSGIPEIKCFLNGIDLPNIVRVQTLICKVMGVTFSVAAGLPVGKEGPMVHSGAVVAAGISQGRTKFWGVDTSFSKFSDFRNDREKRDFVACGAAAGVTSAFGAPIGGVLFSLEEGASYWSTKLTWRAFFCAMITLGTLFWVKNVDSRWGQANFEKLFSFGEFNSLTGEASNFSIWELLLFIIIGCLGGLIGAVFNAANEHLTIWRMKHVNHSKLRRIGEVIVVSIIMSTVSFVMPLIWNRCTELPTDMQDWSNQEKNLVDNLVPFRCEAGKEYNEVASLILADADTAIKQLFHFREAGQDDSSTFSSAALFLFFLPYIIMATVTYGIAVPSGLFVPSLLSGAAFGRLFGHLLHKLDHTNGTFADSGTYALMGAAAVLGGMARMTISLTVILLEATGDMQYVLPLMLTLMAARFTGNVFNEGLYDIHIKLRKIPFLEPEVPSIAEKHEIVAGQVMSTDVKCLRPVERAGVVYDLLKNCSHGTFPIVDTATSGTLYGTASRSMLCTLLQRRAFGSPEVLPELDEYEGRGGGFDSLGPRRLSPLVQWDTIERVYPRYPTIDDVEMRSADRQNWLDLRPYANTAPYTVNETASIQRTYRLFRTLGLRFLCVVNYNNQVVGIITRKDLLPEALSESLLRGRYAHMVHLDQEGFHEE